MEVTQKKLAKMLFIYNALNDGYTATKKDDSYVFTKDKSKVKSVYKPDFLQKFIKVLPESISLLRYSFIFCLFKAISTSQIILNRSHLISIFIIYIKVKLKTK